MYYSIRTKKIIKAVPACNVLADIGCDHGIIPYYLLKNGVCKTAVLTDISFNSLNKAKKLIGKKFDAKFVLGDGVKALESFDTAIDVCLVCGMGGMEIKDILSANTVKVKRFILQPMTNIIELRKFLTDNNFNIIRDYLIFDKKRFYDIIITERGKCSLTKQELYFGKDNLKEMTPEFVRYLNYKKNLANKILKGLDKASAKFSELKNYAGLIDRTLEIE